MGPPGPAEGPEVAWTASAGPGPVPVAGEARAQRKGPFPAESVKTLRAWFLEHGHQQHPSRAEEQVLSEQTGLSSRQVCKWLSNTCQHGKLQEGDAPQQVAAGHCDDRAAPVTQPGHSEPAVRPEAWPRGPEMHYLLPHPPLMAQEAWGHLLHPDFAPARRFTLRICVRHTITVYTIRPLWLVYPIPVRVEQRAEFSNLHVLADAAVQRAVEQEQQSPRGAHQ